MDGAVPGLFLMVVVPFSALGTNGCVHDRTIDRVAVSAEVTRPSFFFADCGGFNVDGDVSGTVTVRLSHVAPEAAFAVVLEPARLEAHDVDGFLFITRRAR